MKRFGLLFTVFTVVFTFSHHSLHAHNHFQNEETACCYTYSVTSVDLVDCDNLAFISFQNWFDRGFDFEYAIIHARKDFNDCMNTPVGVSPNGDGWQGVRGKCEDYTLDA